MDSESSVEKLKRKLYARGEKPKLRPRRPLHEDVHDDVPHAWDAGEKVDSKQQKPLEEKDPRQVLDDLYHGRVDGVEGVFAEEPQTQKEEKEEPSIGSRIIKLIFIVSFLFFLFSIGIAAYFLIAGKNAVSCDNVEIGISGPRTIASGKKLTLDVEVTNNNPVAMREAYVEVMFPQGTKDAEYSSVNLPARKEQIGTIEVGERVRTVARAILFGQEQTEQEVRSVVTYGIDDSNATFSCENSYTIFISTAPVSLNVEGLEEISSGQQLELEVVIASNSEEVVPDQRLKVEYPFGFEFVSAEPEPSAGNNVWDLGDITPGMEQVVTLRGTVVGQGVESRAISFSVGDRDPADTETLGTILQKIEHPLLVTRPFLDLALTLNKSDDVTVVGQLGGQVKGELAWKNTLPSALHDVEIDLKMQGVMLDKTTVNAADGYFRSVDSTVTWTPQTTREDFRVVEPDEEGTLNFNFETKPFAGGASIENPSMQLEFEVRARRISDNIPVPQHLVGQEKRIIKFESELAIDAYGLFGVGPFTNTGPHPPRVDEETTYTIALEVTNTTNNVHNAVVTGVLPVNVSWVGATSPSSESVTYNPVTREVSWSLGDVSRGVGTEVSARKVYIQVSITPSITEVKREATLMSDIKIQGVDDFTDTVLQREAREVGTTLKKDPLFTGVNGVVGE